MSDTPKDIDASWHSLATEQVLERLEVSRHGLDDHEACARRERYGVNELPAARARGPVKRFLLQFHNVLIYVLLVAAGVTALLGHWLDTGVILGVVVVNALIGFIQEGRAERALDSIRKMLSISALVRRGGDRRKVPAEELVPGDIVLLQSGDKVPADLRLLECKDLRLEEAVLTGESLAVEKSPEPVDTDAVLGDRTSMAFSGTFVSYGQGTGVVVTIGAETEVGRINRMLSEVQELTTPLLRQIARFGRALTVAILLLSAATFAVGYLLRGYGFGEIFLAVVGIAVAAIPEGLPAIITITLAIGVQRMASRHAIIRRLPAVETLGSITVICSDKTGTLTRNEMSVRTIATYDTRFEVSGSGYGPAGEVMNGEQVIEIDQNPVLAELVRIAVLCNDAALHRGDDDAWTLDGDPTEGALLSLGMKAGMGARELGEQYPRRDLIPFESEHRFMATLNHDHSGNAFVCVKGAPERVLEMCKLQRTLDGDRAVDRDHWQRISHEIADAGQRLLGFGVQPAAPDKHGLAIHDLQQDLVFLGFVGIMDPPRDEAIKAVQVCQSGGIGVKMITGDHARTAAAIAARLGIGDGTSVLTGHDLDRLDDTELAARVLDIDVFARASPEHKLRLVRALQARDQVVAMTGDGVNDAPALKQSDVGVAMGIKGTEVSKQAAQMVLADDNFASITAAIQEGRTVYDNIKKALLFILPTNGGQAFTIVAAILFGMTLPITPLQILWVNMVTAVTLALALAFEPTEPGTMQRPPRPVKQALLNRYGIWRVAYVSMLLVVVTLGFFMYEYVSNGANLELARTTAVNALVVAQIFYLFNSRYILASSLHAEAFNGSRHVLIAIAVIIVLQLAFTYTGPMQTLFGTQGLPPATWALLALAGAAVFIIVEIEKAIFRGRGIAADRA
jgi:magnesium-transporting ATPase (P-type)